jgi:hypothetical protein
MLRKLALTFLLLAIFVVMPAHGQESLDKSTSDILKLMPHTLKPFTPIQPPPIQMPEPVPKNLLELADECLGKYQCLHKWLHPSYSVAFARIGCHCYSGRCRPTTYKTVEVTDEYPMGIAIWANDRWCPVTAHTLRRNDSRIPEILRQFKAHVCVGVNGCEEFECAILDTRG